MTSGKCSSNIFSAFVDVLILSLRELPGLIVICMAKSPSSRVGTNSAPSLLKMKTDTKSMASTPKITNFGNLNARFSEGSYHFFNWLIIMSAIEKLFLMFLLRTNAAIIGTYVTERISAPKTAKLTV